MAEENKVVDEVKTVDETKISNNILNGLKELFKPREETIVDDIPKLTPEDVDKIIEERVNAKLSEVIPKAKKEKEAALNAEKEALESEKKSLEVAKQLENVDPNFKDFVKYQAESLGKSVEDYVTENPQYKNVSKPTATSTSSNAVKGVELSGADKMIYDNYKRSGLIK